MTETDCVFCDLTQFRATDVCFENAFCLYASTRDPRDPPDVLPGCGVVIPIAHRLSPFDFTTHGTPHYCCLKRERPSEPEARPGRLRGLGVAIGESQFASLRDDGKDRGSEKEGGSEDP
jgi:hypothetical protein